MRIQARAHWTVKCGNRTEEYEDAAWPRRPVDREVPVFACAVADGATETSFAGAWANLLARAYCRGHLDPHRLHRSLPRLRERWRRDAHTRPLPWYAEEKARAGAFAAAVGLTIRHDAAGMRWNALAVGDSCLFHLRCDGLLATFPLSRSSEFTSRPALLGSTGACPDLSSAAGDAQPGDRFFLMTDALASWFLHEHESDRAPWRRLHRSAWCGGSFQRWVDDLRGEKGIRNDDVTLLSVYVT